MNSYYPGSGIGVIFHNPTYYQLEKHQQERVKLQSSIFLIQDRVTDKAKTQILLLGRMKNDDVLIGVTS